MDEIGDLPIALQAKLLRVLQNRSFRRVGGREEIELTARVIAATNKDLDEAVRQNEFREDLLYRLKVFTIQIPPLRERVADVVPITWFHLDQLNKRLQRKVKRVHPEVLSRFEDYSWPGNVRRLAHVIERMMILTDGEVLRPEHLPPELVQDGMFEAANREPEPDNEYDLLLPSRYRDLTFKEAKAEVVADFSRRYLSYRLLQHGGNVRAAADASGMQRPNFKREMKKFGVDRPR